MYSRATGNWRACPTDMGVRSGSRRHAHPMAKSRNKVSTSLHFQRSWKMNDSILRVLASAYTLFHRILKERMVNMDSTNTGLGELCSAFLTWCSSSNTNKPKLFL